jgi:nucleotide-binding universal stress UspA family protein
MFERILVAVDGSNHSMEALKLAVSIQQKFDAELLLLCVYRHHSLLEATMSMVRPEDPESLDDSMREYSSGVVEQAKKLAAGLGAKKVRGFIKSGPPSRTIVGFAAEKGADLIVVGSRGHGDVERYLLGSVSHKVTSLAECPVLVA